MSDEGAASAGGQATTNANAESFGKVAETVERLVSTARVGAAFGEPQTQGNRTVIPVAEVMCGCGLGFGGGTEPAAQRAGTAGGWGGGAGGGARSRPVAVVIIEPEGVRIQPIVDATQLALAGITAGAFFLLWIGRLVRKSQATRQSTEAQSIKGLRRLFRA